MRLLIISPRFAPSNGADTHRVRALLRPLCDLGCDVTVLACRPEMDRSPIDPWLLKTIDHRVKVIRVGGLGRSFEKIPGLGSLSARCYHALKQAGLAILREKAHDFVIFSTTEFPTIHLGRSWLRKTGTRYIVDYQDPWTSTYYRDHPEVTPPGGRLKFAIINSINAHLERQTARDASGFISVSASYIRTLEEGVIGTPVKSLVQPFPFNHDDQAQMVTGSATKTDPTSKSPREWLYIGRGGADMHRACSIFFKWLARQPAGSNTARFVGTSYAAHGTGQKSIEPLARDLGVGHLVSEEPSRVSFSEALRAIAHSDALIVPGSDDPAYTASKIFPYLNSKKPLVAIFHERSSVCEIMKRYGGGTLLTFSEEGPSIEEDAEALLRMAPVGTAHEATPLSDSIWDTYGQDASAKELLSFLEGLEHPRTTIPASLQAQN